MLNHSWAKCFEMP